MRERKGVLHGASSTDGGGAAVPTGTRRPCDLLPQSRQLQRSQGGTQRHKHPDPTLSTTFTVEAAAQAVKRRQEDGLKVATGRLRPLGGRCGDTTYRPGAFTDDSAPLHRGAPGPAPSQLNPLLNQPVGGTTQDPPVYPQTQQAQDAYAGFVSTIDPKCLGKGKRKGEMLTTLPQAGAQRRLRPTLAVAVPQPVVGPRQEEPPEKAKQCERASPRRRQGKDAAAAAPPPCLPCGVPLIDQRIVQKGSIWHWIHRFETCGGDMAVAYFRPTRAAAFIPAGFAPHHHLAGLPTPSTNPDLASPLQRPAARQPSLLPAFGSTMPHSDGWGVGTARHAPPPPHLAAPQLPSVAHYIPKFSLEHAPRALIDTGNCYRFERGYVILTEGGVDVEQNTAVEYLHEALSIYQIRCIAPFLVVKMPLWKVFVAWKGATSRHRFDLAQEHLAQSLFSLHPSLNKFIRGAHEEFCKIAEERIFSFADAPCTVDEYANHRYGCSNAVTAQLHRLYKQVVGLLHQGCAALVDTGSYNGRPLAELHALYLMHPAEKLKKKSGGDDDESALSYGEVGYVEAQLRRLRGFLAYAEQQHATALVEVAVASAQLLVDQLLDTQRFSMQLTIDAASQQLSYVPELQTFAQILDKSLESIKAITSLIPALAKDEIFAKYFSTAEKPPVSKVAATLELHGEFIRLPEVLQERAAGAIVEAAVFRDSFNGLMARFFDALERVKIFGDTARAARHDIDLLGEEVDALQALREKIEEIGDSKHLTLFFVSTDSLRTALLPALDAALQTVLEQFPAVVEHVHQEFEAILTGICNQGAVEPTTAHEYRTQIQFGFKLQVQHPELEEGHRNCIAFMLLYVRLIRLCHAEGMHDTTAIETPLKVAWAAYQELYKGLDTARGELLEKYKTEFRLVYGTMCKEVVEVMNDAADPAYDDPAANPQTMIKETGWFAKRLTDVRDTLNAFNAFHNDVGVPEEWITDLDESIKLVEERNKLWGTWKRFMNNVRMWDATALTVLDTQAMSESLTVTKMEMLAVTHCDHHAAKRNRLVAKLEEELLRHCKLLPVIEALSCRHLTSNHFLALDNIMGWAVQESSKAAKSGLTVGDLGNGCIAVSDQLIRVAQTATLEHSIASEFDAIKRLWYQEELLNDTWFGVIDNEYMVLENADEVESQLESWAGTLGVLVKAPKVDLISSSLRRSVEDFEAKVQKALGLVRTLGASQRLWMGLEPVFGSLEFQRSLGGDARLFSEFDKAFRDTVRKIQTNGRTLEVLISQSIAPGVDALRGKGTANAEFFSARITKLLNQRREAHPRLCFLSDTALITALATYPKVPNHPALLTALGDGIVDVSKRPLNKGTELSIEGLVTSDGTALAFTKPLIAPRTVDRFLTQVVYCMKKSMANAVTQHVKMALPRGSPRDDSVPPPPAAVENPITALCDLAFSDHSPPPQIISLLWRVHHSHMLEDARERDDARALAQYRRRFRSGLKEAARMLKNKGSPAAVMAMHRLVMLMLHEQHVMEEGGVSECHQVRYVYDDAAQEVFLTTKMNKAVVRLPYGHELLGGQFMEPLHPSPAFGIFVRCSVMAQGVLLCKGHPVNVKDLGYLAGRQVLDLHLAEFWDASELNRTLSLRIFGAVACGWWMTVRNLDAFTEDHPVLPPTPTCLRGLVKIHVPAAAVDMASRSHRFEHSARGIAGFLGRFKVEAGSMQLTPESDEQPLVEEVAAPAEDAAAMSEQKKAERKEQLEGIQALLAAANRITEEENLEALHRASGARVPLDQLQTTDGVFSNYLIHCAWHQNSDPPPTPKRPRRRGGSTLSRVNSASPPPPPLATETQPIAALEVTRVPSAVSLASSRGSQCSQDPGLNLSAVSPPGDGGLRVSPRVSLVGSSSGRRGRASTTVARTPGGRGRRESQGRRESAGGSGHPERREAAARKGSLPPADALSVRRAMSNSRRSRSSTVLQSLMGGSGQHAAAKNQKDASPVGSPVDPAPLEVSLPALNPLGGSVDSDPAAEGVVLVDPVGDPMESEEDEADASDDLWEGQWVGKVSFVERIPPPTAAQLEYLVCTSLTVACLNIDAACSSVADVVEYVHAASKLWRGRHGPPPAVIVDWLCATYVEVSCHTGLQTSLDFIASQVCAGVAQQYSVGDQVLPLARRLSQSRLAQPPALGEDSLPAPFVPAVTAGLMHCAANHPFCVHGGAGAGKTPVLRYVAQRLKLNRTTIVPNACSAQELFGYVGKTGSGSPRWVDGLLGTAVENAVKSETKLMVVFDGSPMPGWFLPLRDLLDPPHVMRFSSVEEPFSHGRDLQFAFETSDLSHAPPSFFATVLVLHLQASALSIRDTILWQIQAFFVRIESEGTGLDAEDVEPARRTTPELCRLTSKYLTRNAACIEGAVKATIKEGCHVIPVTERYLAENIASILVALLLEIHNDGLGMDGELPGKVKEAVYFAALWGGGGSCTPTGRRKLAALLQGMAGPHTAMLVGQNGGATRFDYDFAGARWEEMCSAAGYATADAVRCAALARYHIKAGRSVALCGPEASGKTFRMELVLGRLAHAHKDRQAASDEEEQDDAVLTQSPRGPLRSNAAGPPRGSLSETIRRKSIPNERTEAAMLAESIRPGFVKSQQQPPAPTRPAPAPRPKPQHLIVRFGMRHADRAYSDGKLRDGLRKASERCRSLVVVVEDIGCCRAAPNPCEVLREAVLLRVGRRSGGDSRDHATKTLNDVVAYGTAFPAPTILASLRSSTAREMKALETGSALGNSLSIAGDDAPRAVEVHPMAHLLPKTAVVGVDEDDAAAALPKICGLLVNQAITLGSPLHYLLPVPGLAHVFIDLLQHTTPDGAPCVSALSIFRCCRAAIPAAARMVSITAGSPSKDDYATLALDVASLQLVPELAVAARREVLRAKYPQQQQPPEPAKVSAGDPSAALDSLGASAPPREAADVPGEVQSVEGRLDEMRAFFSGSLQTRLHVKAGEMAHVLQREGTAVDDGLAEFAGRVMWRAPKASEMALLRYLARHLHQSAHVIAVFDDFDGETERSCDRQLQSFNELVKYAAEYLARAFIEVSTLPPAHLEMMLNAPLERTCPTVLLHPRGTPAPYLSLSHVASSTTKQRLQCIFVETLREPNPSVPDSVRAHCSTLLFNSSATFPSLL